MLRAAATLLEADGRDALTTRAVAAAAGVQPPALYRLFGDKRGLLDALGAHGFQEYFDTKRAADAGGDPVQALRDGWDVHVSFGLTHPAYYLLVYGEPAEAGSPAARIADALLRRLLARVAAAGRLGQSLDRAAALMQAGGVGVVLTLLAVPAAERDPGLSSLTREAILSTITTDSPAATAATAEIAGAGVAGPRASAVTLATALRGEGDAQEPARASGASFTDAERALLVQWLDRIAEA